MKKIITFSLVLASLSLSVVAQNQRAEPVERTRKEQMDKPGKKFGEELGLTEAQKTQMKALRAEYKQKMEALRASELSKEQMHAQRKAIQEERKTKMKAILTADQWQKMEQMKKDRKMNKGSEGHRKGYGRKDGQFKKQN